MPSSVFAETVRYFEVWLIALAVSFTGATIVRVGFDRQLFPNITDDRPYWMGMVDSYFWFGLAGTGLQLVARYEFPPADAAALTMFVFWSLYNVGSAIVFWLPKCFLKRWYPVATFTNNYPEKVWISILGGVVLSVVAAISLHQIAGYALNAPPPPVAVLVVLFVVFFGLVTLARRQARRSAPPIVVPQLAFPPANPAPPPAKPSTGPTANNENGPYLPIHRYWRGALVVFGVLGIIVSAIIFMRPPSRETRAEESDKVVRITKSQPEPTTYALGLLSFGGLFLFLAANGLKISKVSKDVVDAAMVNGDGNSYNKAIRDASFAQPPPSTTGLTSEQVVEAFKRYGFGDEDLKDRSDLLRMILLQHGIATKDQLESMIANQGVRLTLGRLYVDELDRSPSHPLDPVGLAVYGSILFNQKLAKEVIDVVRQDIRRSPEYQNKHKRQ